MEENASERFEIAVKVTRETNQASNLNEVFSRYGCNTLEAKVPIVSNNVADRLKNASYEEQTYGTLEVKSESATNAVEGRIPRTRDRPLQLVNLGRDVLIAAGKQREKSPVERSDLDDDLDQYMRETARIREERAKEKEARAKLQSGGINFEIPNFKRHFDD